MSKKRKISGVGAISLTLFKLFGIIVAGVTWGEAEDCSENAPWGLSPWQLVYSILGLIAAIAWLVSFIYDVCVGCNWSQPRIARVVGIPYLVISFAFHVLGWFILFSYRTYDECVSSGTVDTSFAWKFALANLIIFYPYLVLALYLFNKFLCH